MERQPTPLIDSIAPELRAAAQGRGFVMLDFDFWMQLRAEVEREALRVYNGPPFVSRAGLEAFAHHVLVLGVNVAGG